jgi:hypothetical protein
MDLAKVKRDDWILAGVALVLVIDLLALPFYSPPFFSLSATDAPDGWLGLLAVLTSLLIVADLAVERLSPATKVPAVAGSRATTRLVLAVATAVLMLLKVILNGQVGLLGFGFWLGLILVAALIYLGMQARQGVAFAMPTRLQNSGRSNAAPAANAEREPPGAGAQPSERSPVAPSAGPSDPPVV